MISVEFVISDNKILSFSVQGHSGLAPAPHDILCASVSAMTELTLNTLIEVFGAEIDLEIDEEKPLISAWDISSPEENEMAVQGVLKGFYMQLSDLRETYSTNLSVKTKKI